jgi:hypothetical protein
MEKVADELSQQGLIFYDPAQNEWAIALGSSLRLLGGLVNFLSS